MSATSHAHTEPVPAPVPAPTGPTTPDWLAKRGGELRRGVNDLTWLILLNGSPHYRLSITPVKGKFGCSVIQTNNGKRLDKGTAGASTDAALQTGLADLRETLGW